MPHYSEDRCSGCGDITSPERLTIKRANFSSRTASSKIKRSRVVAWLCDECLDKDPDWNRRPYGSPGMTSEALERVRNGEVT
jgi:hypothetical protein